MRRLLIIAAALTAAAFALSGCGPASSSTDAGGTRGGGAKQATCDLAPTSLIKQALGLDVAAPSSNDNGSVLVCTYPPSSGASHTVLVRFDTASSAAQFIVTRDSYATQNMQTQDYPGFADEAYTNTLSAVSITTNTLVARRGSVEILVSSSASFDQEKTLEQTLFDALA
jgi:hypothetical protein